MKLLTIFALACLSLAAAAPDAKTEKEIKATLEAYKQALLQRDRAALEKLFAPDLVYTHSTARVENKTQAIEAAINGTDRYEAIEIALYHTLGKLPEPKFTHEFC